MPTFGPIQCATGAPWVDLSPRRCHPGTVIDNARTEPDAEPEDDAALLADAVKSWTRIVAWVLGVGGVIGFVASFVLTVERFELAADPDYVPSCNFNPVLSCGSVMAQPQAALFGFPNPLLGVAGFAVVITIGAALFAGARFAGWFWAGLQVGVTLAMAFICWLIYSSLYSIGALCPYCMVVWAATLPIFVFVTVRNAHASGLTSRSGLALFLARSHAAVLVLAVGVVIVLIAVRFWSYWSSLY
ncbi:vitamin K epoxide reductase [Gordonia jinghuaiqii]|uniref:Vitamin K epoxide reductase family protein n=1 Tax=Gordonia jinghuaiqii TaxID=2758710 RepID=A0A7D7LTD0_9ACTN|nr:vitamin K epoxide reductase [Gordonia jinghuaiqii]QMT02965.1 vitamin K epoxide reductase family protein [Gordonia jinghuaiqii]